MKERPILFSSSMVLALLAGRKTQTRRIIDPQPDGANASARWSYCVSSTDKSSEGTFTCAVVDPAGGRFTERGRERELLTVRCPYAARLWVRESYALKGFHQDAENCDADEVERALVTCRYAADGTERHAVRLTKAEAKRLRERVTDRHRVWSGRFMYKSCARITLEVTHVRVERLNDISEEDAIAEGIEGHTITNALTLESDRTWRDYAGEPDPFEWFGNPRDSFRSLWESINGPESWKANPWVWVVNFKRVEPKENRHG